MTKCILVLAGLLTAVVASATLVGRFTNWNDLTQQSPNIIIAKCVATAEADKPEIIQDNIVQSEIDVLSVLKGNTKLGPARLRSAYWPYPDQRLLLFATYRNDQYFTGYSANEEYRVVPLNHYFQTNMLSGTNLQEQIRWVLQNRLHDLDEELAKGQWEKNRLEKELKGQKQQ